MPCSFEVMFLKCFRWESTAIQKSAYTNSKNPFVVAMMKGGTELSILVTLNLYSHLYTAFLSLRTTSGLQQNSDQN